MKDNGGANPQAGIFAGVRVIDFSHILSGPSCAQHLADLGAEVIKIERPPAGDPMRIMPYFKNGVSSFFMWHNRGKKCIGLDVGRPQGKEIFKDLVKVSDVLVQNRKVGAMDRLGLGYEALKKINPGLIMCSISGYGQDGPLADWPANDLDVQVMSGVAALQGHPDGPPLPSWVSWVDSGTGVHAFGAISAALYHREKTGVGQHIDMSMFDVAFTFHDYPILEYVGSEGKINRTRKGGVHPTVGPMGVYECRDGYLVLAATNDGPWRRLAGLMGKPELADDLRFDTAPHRRDNMDEVNRLISDWIKGFDVADAKILLEENEIRATLVLSIEEVVNHPIIEAREMLVEVDAPFGGKIKLPNSAFRFSETKPNARRRAPLFGEHNNEVLTSVLGYSKEHIAELWEKKVLYAEEAVSRLSDPS